MFGRVTQNLKVHMLFFLNFISAFCNSVYHFFIGWIAPDPSDSKRAMCKLCNCSLLAHKKDLLLHGKSKKHAESLKRCNATPSRKITDYAKISISTNRKIAELKTAAFIAEHCSNRSADHLSALINGLDENSELLKNIKIHRMKCTALILNVMFVR